MNSFETMPKTEQDPKGKKALAWKRKRREIDELADSTGLGMDEDIKETVTAFNMHGLNTTGSCEGHVDVGLPFPWVDVGAENKPKWRYEGEEKIFAAVAEEKGIPESHLRRDSDDWNFDEYMIVYNKCGERIVEILKAGNLRDTEEYALWMQANARIHAKTTGLVAAYKAERGEVNSDVEITISGNADSEFRVRPHSGFDRDVDSLRWTEKNVGKDGEYSAETKKSLQGKLVARQNEMNNFASFLRDAYLDDLES